MVHKVEVIHFDKIAQSSTLCAYCLAAVPGCLLPLSQFWGGGGVDSVQKGSSENTIQKILPRSVGADQLALHPPPGQRA